MNKTVIILIIAYLIIGRLLHEHSELELSKKSFFRYNKIEIIIYFMDLLLWPFFWLIVFYEKYLKRE